MKISKSLEMKLENAKKEKLSFSAKEMYIAGKVRLSKAEQVSKKSNKGKGWVSPIIKGFIIKTKTKKETETETEN